MKPDWLAEAIGKGFQGMLTLRLEGAPAEDTIEHTKRAWVAVLASLPHTWAQERDAQRIQQAFITLAGKCERWPAPRAFIECLPPVAPLLALDAPKGKHTDESRRMVSDLLKKMKRRFGDRAEGSV